MDKPTDVTDAMIEAGLEALDREIGIRNAEEDRALVETIYRAMEAANPIERFDIADLYAEAYRDGMNAARPPVQTDGLVARYDAGLLGDGGGGDVDWWQDYIRAELERAHEFYSDQHEALQRSNAEKDEALLDWQNSWLCPDTNFAQQVPRLLKATDKALSPVPADGSSETSND